MLRVILNKSWRQHPTRHQLYGHLPPITKTIQVRRTRHAGHCWRSKDELISDVLLWTPAYGRAKSGRPARTYIQQLYGIRDVALKTCQGRWMIGRSGERVSGISVLASRHDDDDIYIYIYIYMCVCVCGCVFRIIIIIKSRSPRGVPWLTHHHSYLVSELDPRVTGLARAASHTCLADKQWQAQIPITPDLHVERIYDQQAHLACVPGDLVKASIVHITPSDLMTNIVQQSTWCSSGPTYPTPKFPL